MKIIPNPELFNIAVSTSKAKNMNELSRRACLNYQTVRKLAGCDEEPFEPKTFSILSRYYKALGITASDLASMRMSDIFLITD